MAGKWSKKSKKCARDSVKSFREMSWAEPIRKSLKFSLEPKRILQFLILDIAALIAVFMIASQDTLLLTLISYTEGTLPAESMYMMAGVISVAAVWFILNLWITGAMIVQSKSGNKYKESWKMSFSRLHSLLMVVILVFLVSLAVSQVPYIGALLGVVAALAFLFAQQFVMLENEGFAGSIRRAVHTFRGKVLNVFATWFLAQFIVTVIVLLFIMPMVLFSLSLDPEHGSEDVFINTYLFADPGVLAALAVFFLLGMSISRIFSIKFVTEIFLQFRKNKWLPA